MQRVELERDFDQPVSRVYAYLSEHENLGPVIGATVTRVRDGDTARNGEGSVRRLRIAVLPTFDETITVAVPDERIEYRITRGSPLRGHHGLLEFTPNGTGCRFRWVISFSAAVPGLDRVVAAALRRNISRGLDRVAANA